MSRRLARLGRIALREYLSYVRTIGFWLSMALMPIGLTLGVSLPGLMERAAPQQTLAVVDLTGGGYAPRLGSALAEREGRAVVQAMRLAAVGAAGPEAGETIQAAFDSGGEPAARARLAQIAPRAAAGFRTPPPAVLLAPAPPEAVAATNAEEAAATLKPYLSGDRLLADGRRLTAAAVIRPGAGDTGPALDFWTSDLADDVAEARVSSALERLTREDRMRASGVDPDRLRAIEDQTLAVRTLSLKAADGEVSLRDRLPSLVGFAMGMLLWSVVLTGAGILLNSVIEEKSSRILEVLLSSASTAEIMGGKIAGVAMTTLTVMAVWAGLGTFLLLSGAPGMAEDLGAVLLGRGFLLYFAVYLIGGYLMYAAAFAAIGAFCETTREAQTLLGPVMVLLTVPVLFMTLAIRNPEADILKVLSWVPPFTPFIMVARAGGEPALWEIAGTIAVMGLTTAGVLWLSARAFRAGALSTVKLEPGALLAVLRRRKATPQLSSSRPQ